MEEVRWYWMSDNGWLPFKEQINQQLETGVKKGKKFIRIDAERYVDVKKKFQARYDDPGRSRAVKRVEGNLDEEEIQKQKFQPVNKNQIIKKGNSVVDPPSGLQQTCHVLEEGKENF